MARWYNFMKACSILEKSQNLHWKIVKQLTGNKHTVDVSWSHDDQINPANKSYFTIDLTALILSKCSLFWNCPSSLNLPLDIPHRKFRATRDKFLSQTPSSFKFPLIWSIAANKGQWIQMSTKPSACVRTLCHYVLPSWLNSNLL